MIQHHLYLIVGKNLHVDFYTIIGLIPSPYLSYLFLTKMELSLIIPFMLEPFSIISQSPTLSNRLSINIPAGSLSIQSLSVAIIIFSTYLVIINIVFRLYLIIYNFEILNSFVQLFIPNLSSIEYLLIIFYSSLSFIPYYPELSVQLILPFIIMIITSTFLFTAFNTLILQLFTISLFCILYSKSAQLPFSTRSSNAISAPTPISALSHSPTMVIAGVFLGIIIDDMIIIITDYFSFICLFFY